MTLFFLSPLVSIAQMDYDANWITGYNAGVPGPNGVRISFASDTVKISAMNLEFDLLSTNSSFSDSIGTLAYYFNGCSITFPTGEIEDGFNPGWVYDEFCGDKGNFGYQALYQSALSLPFNDKELLLHQSVNVIESPLKVYTDKLYTSKVVEHSIENKNNLIFEDTLSAGGLTSVYNNVDSCWWVVRNIEHTNEYHTFCIKYDTILHKSIQSIGIPHTWHSGIPVKYNSTGDQYASYNPAEGVYLYSFDRATGQLFNFRHVDIPLDDRVQILTGGLEFSPSGQYLYVNDSYNIYQLDMYADHVPSSLIKVAEQDGFIGNSLGQITSFGSMELGPDCRIWINTDAALPYLHVILQPDKRDTACQVMQHAVKLPHPHGTSLPHYPNYRIDSPYPRCDSTKVLILDSISTATHDLSHDGRSKLYPNPFQNLLTIQSQDALDNVIVYNLQGQRVYSTYNDQYELTINTEKWADGLYVVHLYYSNGRTERIKVVKE